jgi:hydrogenase-4 component F
MSAVCFVQHAGLLWVFVEATTLATAPMIYIHKSPRSLEAAWKYLLICSVGIALALFGNILITIADQGYKDGTAVSLLFSDLAKAAPRMNGKLLKAAFIFLVIGYGTKMGLAPLHTWLPDAHSEAPGFVSALSRARSSTARSSPSSGFSPSCAGPMESRGGFLRVILRGFGLVSMGTAAVFLANQKDYKRLLAYSSIEHMGILSFGVGWAGWVRTAPLPTMIIPWQRRRSSSPQEHPAHVSDKGRGARRRNGPARAVLRGPVDRRIPR